MGFLAGRLLMESDIPGRKIDRWVMVAGFIVLAVILTVECAAVFGTSGASASYRHDSPSLGFEMRQS
jgi:hypothetical protein